jgi:hypothetical protein
VKGALQGAAFHGVESIGDEYALKFVESTLKGHGESPHGGGTPEPTRGVPDDQARVAAPESKPSTNSSQSCAQGCGSDPPDPADATDPPSKGPFTVGATLVASSDQGGWHQVQATREGDTGRQMANQQILKKDTRSVALPDRSALGRDVEIRYGGRTVVAPVKDVGPHNTHDPYWNTDSRPKAESGIGRNVSPSNRAGIDLSDQVTRDLHIMGNPQVEWRFVPRPW